MLRPWQSLCFSTLLCFLLSPALAQRIYWAESSNDRIRVGNLTPTTITGATNLLLFNGVRNIALDPDGEYIYYSETESFQRANMLDGTGSIQIYDKGGMSGYTEMTFSANAGGIFGTGVNDDPGAFFLDLGSQDDAQLPISGLGNDPYVGVAVDDGSEVVFWGNTDRNSIISTNFSTLSGGDLLSPPAGIIEYIYFDDYEQKLYFTSVDGSDYYLYSYDFSTTPTLLYTASSRITSICAYPQFRNAYFVVQGTGIYSVGLDAPHTPALLYSGADIADIDILADYNAPVFTALSPADGDPDVAITGTNLILTFDEAVKLSTTAGAANDLSLRIYETAGSTLFETITRASGNISISGNTVTISGLTEFQPSTNYHVLIGNKVFSDLSGNNFIGISLPTGWNFTTEIDQSQYYSRQSGNWDNLNTWSHAGHAGPPISSQLPGCSGCDIFIGNGHTVTLVDNEETLGNNAGLTIASGGTLDMAGFSFNLGGDLNVQGTLLNAGDITSYFGGIHIYNTSGSLLILNGLILNDGTNGPVTLHSDIVLLNGITTVGGGTFNPNGFNVCNGAGVPPTNPVFSAITNSSVTLSWTAGDGNAFIVARAMGDAAFKPQIASTYTANNAFGSGQQVGAGNYVVYNGTGTSVTITGLSPATAYEFDMYSFSNTVGGCYTVSNYQVTDITTCVTLTAPVSPTDAVYCNGEIKPAITVGNPGSGRTIQWFDAATGGNSVTGDMTGGAGRGEVFIPSLASGTFYAETYDGTFSCSSPTRTPVTLTMHPTLVSGTASVLQTICEGGDPGVITGGTASGGDGTYTYEWTSSSTSGGPYNTIGSAISDTYDPPSGILANTYYQRIVRSSTCNTPSAEITVTVVAPPVIVSNPSGLQRCDGETATFTVSATGTSLTYQWMMDTGTGFQTVSNTGVFSGALTNQLQISNVTGLNNAQFVCDVRASAVCPLTSAAALLTVNALPAVTNQTPSFCESTPGSGIAVVDLTALNNTITGGVSDRSVSWFTNVGLSTPVASPASASATNGIVYYAKVSNTLTNCYATATATITVNAKPVVAATTLKTICSGTATNITFSATPVATYTWTIPAPNGNITGASSGSGSGINQTLNNASSTQQSVTYNVIPKANGCDGNPFTQTVAVDPKPSIFNVTGGGSYCSGTNGVNVGLSNSQSGVTYSLLLAGVATGRTSSPGSGAFDFADITAIGNYTISASTVANCSQLMNGSVQVTMLTSPTGGSIVSSTSSQLCLDDEFTLTVNGVTNSPTSFSWTLPAGITEISKSANTISLKASNGTGGTIAVAASNSCGDGPSLTTAVTVSPLPEVDIILPSVNVYVDEPTSFSFSPIDAGTPSWIFSDGQTSSDIQPVITFTAGGDISVILNVTNSAGCSGSDKDNVKVRSSDIGNFAIKNVVTANGDEANGFLYIENITKDPDSEVILVDRWGTEVFRKKGYDNTWDLKKGEDYLPAGNYVCVVRSKGEVYSRTVTVIKNN